MYDEHLVFPFLGIAGNKDIFGIFADRSVGVVIVVVCMKYHCSHYGCLGNY